MNKEIKLVLENGIVLKGKSFGKRKDVIGDFIFNTSIAGYQEVLTDPSYHQEIVVMTFPVQGIYGINDFDDESLSYSPLAMIVSSYEKKYSNNHAIMGLDEYLNKKSIQGVYDIDTRYLTKIIRKNGSLKGAIVDVDSDEKIIIEKIRNLKLSKHVLSVSPKVIKIKNKKASKNVILYDFGAKNSIEKNIVNRGYKVIRVPYDTKYEDIKKYKPDLIFLSNGPGNPEELKSTIKELKKMIKGNEKICGICLGHQLISIALGCKIKRLKFGHHSINHPVLDLETEKVYVTSQNHNYTVDYKTLPSTVLPIMTSVHDGTIEGIKHYRKKIISVQFHPEASPGPSDANYIFDKFFKFLGCEYA